MPLHQMTPEEAKEFRKNHPLNTTILFSDEAFVTMLNKALSQKIKPETNSGIEGKNAGKERISVLDRSTKMGEFSINKVEIMGRLGKDVEVTYTQDGNTAITSFSVATNRSYKDKNDQWQEQTEWHRVKVFGCTAEALKELKKGDRVYAEGRLQTRKFTDKEGIERHITEIIANRVRAIWSPKSKDAQSQQEQTQYLDEAPTRPSKLTRFSEEFDEDIPF